MNARRASLHQESTVLDARGVLDVGCFRVRARALGFEPANFKAQAVKVLSFRLQSFKLQSFKLQTFKVLSFKLSKL